MGRRHRGRGVGTRLLSALADHALRNGHARIDWTAARADARRRRFYDDLGALADDRMFYRRTGEALEAIAKPPNG